MRTARVVGAAALVLVLAAGACGKSGGGAKKSTGTTVKKEAISIASTNFSENVTLAYVYGKALQAKGYPITFRTSLGSRQIEEPALIKGEIDAYPAYAASELEYLNNNAGQASSDAQQTTTKLRDLFAPKGVSVLEPAPAIDTNAFAVTKATADKYHLTKMSDLAAVASQLVIAVPPECPGNKYCGVGLKSVYGLDVSHGFKDTKSIGIGPLADNALANGDVQVAEVLSTDGIALSKGFVILEDDKHLQNADNVVPVIRTPKLNNEIRDLWNSISAKLTTKELLALNKKTDVDKEDPSAAADQWLRDNGFKK
jgi:osmoprotectant transport system substrate-binding protein